MPPDNHADIRIRSIPVVLIPDGLEASQEAVLRDKFPGSQEAPVGLPPSGGSFNRGWSPYMPLHRCVTVLPLPPRFK